MPINVCRTRDTMYHKTKVIRYNKDIAILSVDKDSSIVIMNKKNYNQKTDDRINDETQKVKYNETGHNILKTLE